MRPSEPSGGSTGALDLLGLLMSLGIEPQSLVNRAPAMSTGTDMSDYERIDRSGGPGANLPSAWEMLNREPAVQYHNGRMYIPVGEPGRIPERTKVRGSRGGVEYSIDAEPGVPVMMNGVTVTPGPGTVDLDSPWGNMLRRLDPAQQTEMIRRMQEEMYKRQR